MLLDGICKVFNFNPIWQHVEEKGTRKYKLQKKEERKNGAVSAREN